MALNLDWEMGFEVEFVAPRGSSRLQLAEKVATNCGGTVSRFFDPQSKPSDSAGRPTFENLTLAFKVTDSSGDYTASFVEDRGISIAIAAPLPGERERCCEIVTAPTAASHETSCRHE